jgi:hypothetical protein
MKKLLLFLVLASVPFVGCSLFEGDPEPGPNELSGTTSDVEYAKQGTPYYVYATLEGVDLGAELDTCYITKNDNGIVTVKLKIDVSKVDPVLKAFIPKDRLDSTGNINTEIHFKATSEGIQDYYYSNGNFDKPFTIIKHDWNVGEKWSFTTDDGKTINREVTEKTGKDEWPLGFFLIKTIKTEETTPAIEGVSRVIFRTNHKFGLVYFEYQLVTGQNIKISIM